MWPLNFVIWKFEMPVLFVDITCMGNSLIITLKRSSGCNDRVDEQWGVVVLGAGGLPEESCGIEATSVGLKISGFLFYPCPPVLFGDIEVTAGGFKFRIGTRAVWFVTEESHGKLNKRSDGYPGIFR